MGFVPIAKRRMTKRYRKSFSSATSRQRMNSMSSASCRHLAVRKPQRCPLSFEWHATIPERIELRETNQTLEAKTKLEDKAPEPSLGPRTESRPNGDVSTGCGQSTRAMKFGSRRRLCRRTLTISSVRSWHCVKCKKRWTRVSGTSSKVKHWKGCETRNENDNQRFRRRRKEAMPRTSPLGAIRSMYWNNLSYCLRCLGSTWMGGRCSTNVRRFFSSSYGSICCV